MIARRTVPARGAEVHRSGARLGGGHRGKAQRSLGRAWLRIGNAAAVSKEWQAWLINTLYWIIPKTAELGRAVVVFVGGSSLPARISDSVAPSQFLSTAAFAAGCLVLSSWLFQRKEF